MNTNDYKFKVNLGGMIELLSGHLYSSPNVFVRELLQNCTDAIHVRADKDSDFDLKTAVVEIEVTEDEQIIFRDNGTGLNEEEIHRFLSVIGQSSKFDIEKGQAQGDYIGRFGIGLLSCFMVTDTIIVRTVSFRSPDITLEWRGHADGTYTITELSEKRPVGTEIILRQDEHKTDVADYYHADEISNLVFYYGLFLQYPIYMISGGEKTRLNLNMKLDAEKNKPLCLKMGKMFLGDDFLDCFNLVSSDGLFSGIAYVLPYPVSANAHHMHRIYLKNMLLTENGDKLLPEWAFFIRCIIHTDRLTPTSSREDFYEDEILEQAGHEIAQCIGNYLESLEIHNDSLLHEIVRIHHLAVKSVIANDDSVSDILMPYIVFQTTLGEMTAREMMDFGSNAFYTTDVNQFRQLAPLYSQRSELLINAGYVYDDKIIRQISEKSTDTSIEKLTDTDIDLLLNDTDMENDAEEFIKAAETILRKYDCRISLKEFMPDDIPTLYTINDNAYNTRQIKRSKEKADAVFSDMLSSFEESFRSDAKACLYFNTNNLVVKKLIASPVTEKTKACIEILYVNALLSGHFPLLNHEMKTLNDNLYTLML
ncbi:MAG TPA: HSP90 family protein [Ruminococcaceae bacterium]|nr:HSP90 family protein [Oscillospiraceae bacterium]